MVKGSIPALDHPAAKAQSFGNFYPAFDQALESSRPRRDAARS